MADRRTGFSTNDILTGLGAMASAAVLGVSGWVLLEVNSQGQKVASQSVQIDVLIKNQDDQKATLRIVSDIANDLRSTVAVIKARDHIP